MAREELEITYSHPNIPTRINTIKSQERQIHGLNSTLHETLERITELSEELNDIKCAIVIHPYSVKESIDMIKDMKEFMKEDYVQQLFILWKKEQEEKAQYERRKQERIEKNISDYEYELHRMNVEIPHSILMYKNYREEYLKKLQNYFIDIKNIKEQMELNRQNKSN